MQKVGVSICLLFQYTGGLVESGSFRVKSTKIYEVGNPTISEFSKKITTCTGTCL